MRLLVLALLWPWLLPGPALADDAAPARMPASATTGSGSAAAWSAWDAVTGQEWHVRMLDDRPVLDGTAITIVFDRAGRVSGNAGTNRYMGAYKRTGSDGLVLSGLGATKMYLDQPPGRMQQEAKYLHALKSVQRFTLEEDDLILWLDEERSIRYGRAP